MRNNDQKVMPTAARANFPSERSNQLQLFSDASLQNQQFVFVDIDRLDENSLLRMVAMNAVSLLIDVRSAPTFERPKFKHEEVTSYLFHHKVEYFEYAFKLKELGDELCGELNSAIGSKSAGLTLCLYDRDAKSRGLCDHARRSIKRSGELGVELSPRAVAGI